MKTFFYAVVAHSCRKVTKEIEDKAHKLETISQYKSDFLANMSHELRTPLNSMIILSELMIDNTEENLSPQQIDTMKVINSASHDLLVLINDILDLSKVEAGKLDIYPKRLNFRFNNSAASSRDFSR